MPVARLRPLSRHVAALDLHGRFQVATFLVRHRHGLALVDAGFPGWEHAILTAARSLPPPNEITHVVLTHSHGDHVGAVAGVLAHMPAEVLCSERERPFVEGASLARSARGLGRRVALTLHARLAGRGVAPVRVTRTLAEGELVCGMRVVAVPGHTPGQIALVHEADRLVLCGDALFHVRGRIGYDPIPGMTMDREAADASLESIARLGIEDVAPSHGPAILGDAPRRIEAFLRRSRR